MRCQVRTLCHMLLKSVMWRSAQEEEENDIYENNESERGIVRLWREKKRRVLGSRYVTALILMKGALMCKDKAPEKERRRAREREKGRKRRDTLIPHRVIREMSHTSSTYFNLDFFSPLKEHYLSPTLSLSPFSYHLSHKLSPSLLPAWNYWVNKCQCSLTWRAGRTTKQSSRHSRPLVKGWGLLFKTGEEPKADYFQTRTTC